jgi:hypothetical protein
MCLFITITLPNEKAISQDTLQSWQLPDLKVKFQLSKSIFSSRGRVLHIADPRGGCACSLMSNRADPDKAVWDLEPEFLPDIAQLLKLLKQNRGCGFAFQALWVNERPLEQKQVSIEELAQFVEQGQISTKNGYLVN